MSPKATTQRAQTLRRNRTLAEHVLWQALRNRALGFKVRRQAPCGPYILDFVLVSQRLAIEIDGETHGTASGIKHDARRDAWLTAHGFRILRFSNREALGNLDGVLMAIGEALKHPHPNPLPLAGEGVRAKLPLLLGQGRSEGDGDA